MISKNNKVLVVVDNDLASFIHLYCTKTRVGEKNTLALFVYNNQKDYNYKLVEYCNKEKIKTFFISTKKIYDASLNLTHCFDVEDLMQLAPDAKERVVTDFTLDPRFPYTEFPPKAKEFLDRTIKDMVLDVIVDTLKCKVIGGKFFNPLKDESTEKLKDLVKFLGLTEEAKKLNLM